MVLWTLLIWTKTFKSHIGRWSPQFWLEQPSMTLSFSNGAQQNGKNKNESISISDGRSTVQFTPIILPLWIVTLCKFYDYLNNLPKLMVGLGYPFLWHFCVCGMLVHISSLGQWFSFVQHIQTRLLGPVPHMMALFWKAWPRHKVQSPSSKAKPWAKAFH